MFLSVETIFPFSGNIFSTIGNTKVCFENYFFKWGKHIFRQWKHMILPIKILSFINRNIFSTSETTSSCLKNFLSQQRNHNSYQWKCSFLSADFFLSSFSQETIFFHQWKLKIFSLKLFLLIVEAYFSLVETNIIIYEIFHQWKNETLSVTTISYQWKHVILRVGLFFLVVDTLLPIAKIYLFIVKNYFSRYLI